MGSGVMLFFTIACFVLGFFKPTLFGLAIIFLITYFGIKSQEDKEALEEKYRKKEKDIYADVEQKRRDNWENEKKLRIEIAKRDIMAALGCSFLDSEKTYDRLNKFSLYYEFTSASDFQKKKQIATRARNYQTYCDEVLLPLVKKNGLNLTERDIINHFDCFTHKLYVGFSAKQKLNFINNAMLRGLEKPSPNIQYLLDTLNSSFDNPSEKFKDGFLYVVGSLSYEDYIKVVRCFTQKFNWEISQESIDEVHDFISKIRCSMDYYTLSAIFAHCLYLSNDEQTSSFFEKAIAEVDDESLICDAVAFHSYVSDLFFDTVFYNIKNVYDVLNTTYIDYVRYYTRAEFNDDWDAIEEELNKLQNKP